MKKYYFRKDRLRIVFGRDKSDPEKSILPSVIFINSNHKSFGEIRSSGFMICLGWWDWSLKFGYIFN